MSPSNDLNSNYASLFVSGFGINISFLGILVFFLGEYLSIKMSCRFVTLFGCIMYFFGSVSAKYSIEPQNTLSTVLYSLGTCTMMLCPYFRYKSMMNKKIHLLVRIGNLVVVGGTFVVYFASRNYISNTYVYIAFPMAAFCTTSVGNTYSAKVIKSIIDSQSSDVAKNNIKSILLRSIILLSVPTASIVVLTFYAIAVNNNLYFELSIVPMMVMLLLFISSDFVIELNKFLNSTVAKITGTFGNKTSVSLSA